MQRDLGTVLAGAWPAALRRASELVHKAEETSRRVAGLPDGPNRRLLSTSWDSDMALARGALAVLRVLNPDDPGLEALWRRLNHCPIIRVTGDKPGPQLQMVQ